MYVLFKFQSIKNSYLIILEISMHFFRIKLCYIFIKILLVHDVSESWNLTYKDGLNFSLFTVLRSNVVFFSFTLLDPNNSCSIFTLGDHNLKMIEHGKLESICIISFHLALTFQIPIYSAVSLTGKCYILITLSDTRFSLFCWKIN